MYHQNSLLIIIVQMGKKQGVIEADAKGRPLMYDSITEADPDGVRTPFFNQKPALFK